MLNYELLRDKSILVLKPEDALNAADFLRVSGVVDPYILETGELKGLLIDATTFPGWDDFAALVQHLKFVRDHHRKIRRVAALTDNTFLKFLPRIAEHFAHPDIRAFGAGERAVAMTWLETGH